MSFLNDGTESCGLFDDVTFVIISGPDLPDADRHALVASLEKEGAKHVQCNSTTGRIDDLHDVTHIISTTSDFPEYEQATDSFLHVVRPSWVQQSLDKRKQMNPRQFSPDHNLFLNDVVISCADIPEGDKEAIAGGVIAMGGMYSSPLTKMVTHLIALSIDDERCQLALRKNLKCSIILPHWFDDCLRLGRKISETPYILPNPEILLRHEQPPLPRVSEDVKGATSPRPPNLPLTPVENSENPRQINVFSNQKVMLAADLDIGANLRQTIVGLIQAGGGAAVETVGEASIYVCHYRDGPDYVLASQKGKEVGNLSWLYHLITHNHWTSPLRRLLHYPIPRNGIPGFENLIISVSNYAGEARLYLENLVKAGGAQFTKTMRQDNTHLISAHMASEKCDAALEWNINVVNHLWLEESYAQHRLQSLTIKKFTHFPPRTNLGEVVGQTRLDPHVLEHNFFPKAGQKPADGQGLSAKRNSNAPQSSAAARQVQTVPVTEPLQEVENMETDEQKAPTAVQKTKRNRTDYTPQTPVLRKIIDSGKENETPGSSGSRGAKERAVSKLHDAAADIALYDKERKRVGGVTHGKDRRASTDNAVTPLAKETRGRKRQSTELEDDEASEPEPTDLVAPKGKRSRTSKLPAITYRMVLTGYQRWADDPNVEAKERNVLRNLGIHITEDTSNCDILCAPKIVRTKKFICSLANAPEVVSTSFLDYCLKTKKIPDPSKHLLHDRDTEERLGIKLCDTLEQARYNGKHLLKGWQIFCTEQVTGGFDTFKSIIEANGGTSMLYKGRTSMNVSKRQFTADSMAAESQGDDKGDTLYLISGSTKQEVALWSKFRQMAEAADMVPVVTRSDWLLSVTMKHVVHWDDKWELNEESL